MSCGLPTKDAIVSCCIEMGPFGMGAYSIQLQAVFLSQYIKGAKFGPTQSEPPPLPQETLLATAEAIHWLGIIVALFLIGHCTFWSVESFSSIIFRIQRALILVFGPLRFHWAYMLSGSVTYQRTYGTAASGVMQQR